MAEISYHPEAEAEIQAATAWYLSRSQAAAIGLVEEIERTIAMIQQSRNCNPPMMRGIVLQSCDVIRTASSIGWNVNASA